MRPACTSVVDEANTSLCAKDQIAAFDKEDSDKVSKRGIPPVSSSLLPVHVQFLTVTERETPMKSTKDVLASTSSILIGPTNAIPFRHRTGEGSEETKAEESGSTTRGGGRKPGLR